MGYTYGTIGELSKGSTLKKGSSGGEGCGQEGESSNRVLHFSFFRLLLASEVSGLFVWFWVLRLMFFSGKWTFNESIGRSSEVTAVKIV